MKHYTIQTLPEKSFRQMTKPEKSLYQKTMLRQKKGIRIPPLCKTTGCDNVTYSFVERCESCGPCKKRMANKTSIKYHRDYKKKHGLSYKDHKLVEVLKEKRQTEFGEFVAI